MRIFCKDFHKRALKYKSVFVLPINLNFNVKLRFNVTRFNELLLLRTNLEAELKKLRDSLAEHQPLEIEPVLESELAI